ncbi:sulfatase [Lentisphaera marina]|uniref:sulfatase family protein n=1 Tax=Lentisphaera marina TaxID=1111041 RepID=UPI0023662095|nr:sulfatase [Lentisphaera marina]MDD7986578.1 sulfatase [Lentisphaera marina]
MIFRTLIISFSLILSLAAKVEQPNFIFIMTDDQGYGDLGCYGHPTIKTPNIDKMAEKGVRFTDFYARHKCSPARASLMTGAFNFRVGVGSIVYPNSTTGLIKEVVTIPEMLKKKGYTSALIGKWHLGHTAGYLPRDQGFDYYFGVPGTNHGDAKTHKLPVIDGFKPSGDFTIEDYWADKGKGVHGNSTILMRNDKVIEWPTDITQLTKRYTHDAVRYIKENKDKPFFLYFAHGTPHHPYTVDAAFRGKSAHGLYGDMIEEIDWSVGEVIKALKESGIEKNTIIAFTSDNGADSKPNKDHAEKGSNLPLKGWKGSSEEGGVRVPFVVSWPGTLPEGKKTNEIASLMDIFPTYAALTGIEPKTPQKIDGKNIFPIMMCEPGVKSPNKYIYYAGNTPKITGVRNHRFKYSTKTSGLYDMHADIGETKNVADKYPEVLQELQKAMEVFQKDIDENSMEAPFDEGQAAYVEIKNKKEKSSKDKKEKTTSKKDKSSKKKNKK